MDALLAQAHAVVDRADPRTGLTLAERALAQARGAGDVARTAHALTIAAGAHRALSEYPQAAKDAHDAIELLDAAGVTAGRVGARVQAALVYFELGDLDRALAHLDDARRDLLLVDDPVADSACAHAEGMVLSRLGDYGLAQPSFERALRLRRRLGDDGAVATTLNSLGVLHLRIAQAQGTAEADAKAEFERAHAYFSEAHDLARRVGDARLEMLSGINVAGALGGQGRLVEALDRFAALLPAAKALSDRYNESLLLANAGEACRRLGQHDRARALCEEALAVAQSIASKVREQQARLQLSLACEAAGDLAGALVHYKAHHALERESHAAEARRRAEAQALRGQIDEMRQEAARLQRESSDLARENRMLERQAREDPLTGLANRRAFDDALDARLAEARAAGRPLAVALFDIDRFKLVNDRFTHAVGDLVLREVADLLRACCRASDVAARLGGEEFVLLLRDADRDRALAIAERVRTEVAAHDWSTLAAGLAVTISAGVAADAGSGTGGALVGDADAAMYRAKRAGRDCVR
ncbi:MAG: GGDEF domain-containing protein [Burkholderiales bacterium]